MLGDPNKIVENVCAVCGHKLDGASGVGNNTVPKPGDVSICIRCTNISVFGDDLKLRKPTENEMKELGRDSNVLKAMALIWLGTQSKKH